MFPNNSSIVKPAGSYRPCKWVGVGLSPVLNMFACPRFKSCACYLSSLQGSLTFFDVYFPHLRKGPDPYSGVPKIKTTHEGYKRGFLGKRFSLDCPGFFVHVRASFLLIWTFFLCSLYAGSILTLVDCFPCVCPLSIGSNSLGWITKKKEVS